MTASMALEEVKEEWMDDAAATIDALANDLQTFTADDFRREMRQPPIANWTGLAFTKAKNAGHIEWVRYVRSNTRTRKGGSVSEWRSASKGAAS